MKAKTFFQSLLLLLVFAAAPMLRAETITDYIPDNSPMALYFDAEALVNMPALNKIIQSFGLDLDTILKEEGLSKDDLKGKLVYFVHDFNEETGDGVSAGVVIAPGQCEKLMKAIQNNEKFQVKPVEFEGAEVFSVVSKNDAEKGEYTLIEFISKDMIQFIEPNQKEKITPVILKAEGGQSSIVRSLKAENAVLSVAIDLSAVSKHMKKMADANAGENSIAGMDISSQLESLKKFKALSFRLGAGADNSLDIALTLRCVDAKARDEIIQNIEMFKKMMTPSAAGSTESDEEGVEEDEKKPAASPLEGLKTEVKGNDAILTLNVSEEALMELLQAGIASVQQSMTGAGAIIGDPLESEEDIIITLEETPDPDEEGISEEEREKRIKMREEAIAKQQRLIEEAAAKKAEAAANREEALRKAKLNKDLLAYAKADKWDLVFEKIKEGADVNARDEKGRTPAFYCAEKGNYTMLTRLDGADLAAVDNSGMSVLHCAVRAKQDSIITYLVKVRACSPRTQMKNGSSPVYDAARAGTTAEFNLLTAYGADVNAATNTGLTPLHQAAARGNQDMVKELLKNGANVNAVAKNGRTPIFYAAARGKAATVSSLLEKKAEINLADEDGLTPLHCAAASGNVTLVKYLVSRKANFAATAKDGTTVLISGAKYPEIVKFLADKMPSVNGVNKDGDSALHLAAATADEETVRKLLYKGAAEDLKNKKGESPLFLAARAGNTVMVKRLVNMDVKVTKEIVEAAANQEIKDMLSAKLKK